MTDVSNANTKLKALKHFSVLLLAILICLPLLAQQTGIGGPVGDPSNAVIANVRVTATAEDGTKVTTTTNAAGQYQFPGLRAETYRLRFEVPGFAPAERTVTLLVGQMASIDVDMQLSQTTSTVNVEAEANAVDTSNSSVAGDVSPSVETGEERRWREHLEQRMAAARARLGHPEPDRDRLREDMAGLTLAEVTCMGASECSHQAEKAMKPDVRAISRRLIKLERVFAPAANSEDGWGSMAKSRDAFFGKPNSWANRPLLNLGKSWSSLALWGSGVKQPAATYAITDSSRAETKALPKRWHEHSGLIRTG